MKRATAGFRVVCGMCRARPAERLGE